MIMGGLLSHLLVNSRVIYRGIAQSGSAPALGAGCRGFESLYPDHDASLNVWLFIHSGVAGEQSQAPVAQSE